MSAKSSNIRFWTWLHDSPVKITIKPGQVLSHGFAYRHDEGWSSESHTWEHSREGLIRAWNTDGTDCDGRLSRVGVDFTRDIGGIDDSQGLTHGNRLISYPKWEAISDSVYDENAQLANY